MTETSEAGPEGATACDARIERVEVSAYTVPTDGPDGKEADGTLVWSSTTMVLVEVQAGGKVGLGYTYGDAAVARLIASTLKPEIEGKSAALVGALWRGLDAHVRNTGRSGVGALARSAVDIALWDLKAKLLDLPLFLALPPFRDRVPIYGSGGFCNYPLARLAAQVSAWAKQGIPRMKIKTSRAPEQDPERLAVCRAALGDDPVLMTDANGALSRKEALTWAWRFRERWNVAWLEEPVSSDDLEGLRLVRDQGPPGLEVAAGEYGFVLRDFRELLLAGAVDCLQADVTRCGGISGLLQVAGLCAAHALELSAHCAPAVSAHAFCAVPRLRHLEYFHDHVRLENMLFDGVSEPVKGSLRPDRTRPGLGIELKRKDAERYRI
ncbi:MAG TPA: enolase C-terminal domain-like protein [Polyangiaceae bacterium]|nr:enolase C-terminal domain-like protein [Polyangiaceae bacterium]